LIALSTAECFICFVNRARYVCDDKFHTEDLSALLMCESMFGFIVMDGNGTLFGTVAGNTRDVIHRFTVDLPKKHSRGGQSALRFSRLRDEKRHNYIRKVAEMAVQHFITNDKVNVTGLVLAGSADFKTELAQSGLFDWRLAAKVVKIVDVSYGGENGFNQVGLIKNCLDIIISVSKFYRQLTLQQSHWPM
jgi:peptide chain release factor subunit 1